MHPTRHVAVYLLVASPLCRKPSPAGKHFFASDCKQNAEAFLIQRALTNLPSGLPAVGRSRTGYDKRYRPMIGKAASGEPQATVSGLYDRPGRRQAGRYSIHPARIRRSAVGHSVSLPAIGLDWGRWEIGSVGMSPTAVASSSCEARCAKIARSGRLGEGITVDPAIRPLSNGLRESRF